MTPTPHPPIRRRSRALVAVGALVIVAALAGAVALYLLGARQADEAVRQLARAPVGCDTTLEFNESGTFVLYVETAGRLERLAGGCDVPTTYQREDRPARLAVELVDRDGTELSLDRTEASSYDNDGFVATRFRQVEIVEGGRHVLRVTSPDDDFVVSIGRDPGDVAGPFKVGALATGVFGAIVGAAILVVGLVRRGGSEHAVPEVVPAPVPLGPPWATQAPVAPPGAPTGDRPGAPPAGERTPFAPPPTAAPSGPPPAPATDHREGDGDRDVWSPPPPPPPAS